jgi:serine protease Do
LLPTSPLPDFAATYERVAPSVVKISTYGKDPLNGTPTPLAMGTGFFFGSPGRILTNAHVVAGGSSFDVELFDGNRVPARLVGRDQLTDLALLAVSEAPAPAPLPPAPPESLAAGMWVMAIGNPLGLEFSATKGIISALNRTDVLWDRVGYWDFIQTDAPINVGNSGGPLVDVEGRVIGVCAAIEKHADRVGFAIPISTASVVASHIERYGKLKRAWLGIQIVRAENQLRVVGVYPDSPAHRAGFLPGDVILDLDGLPEEDVGRMRWKIAVHEIDRPATFRIDREGAEFFLTVQLAEADEVLAPDRR